eukprot:SAG31_NODE_1635_length_7682_cov_5.457471_2_plen_647_part_00
MHSPEQLQALHRAVLDAFKEARPFLTRNSRDKAASLRGWVSHETNLDKACTKYLIRNAEYHVRCALGENDVVSESIELPAEIGSIVRLYPSDVLVTAAYRTLGIERLIALRDQAEAAGDFWMAISASHGAFMRQFAEHGDRACNESMFYDKIPLYLDQLGSGPPTTLTDGEWTHFQIGCRSLVLNHGSYVCPSSSDKLNYAANLARLLELLDKTEVGRADVELKKKTELLGKLFQFYKGDSIDIDKGDTMVLARWQEILAQKSRDGKIATDDCDACVTNGRAFDEISKHPVACFMRLPGWSWSVYGGGMELISAAWSAAKLSDTAGLWGYVTEPDGASAFLAALRGRLDVANSCYASLLRIFNAGAADIALMGQGFCKNYWLPRVCYYNGWPLTMLGRGKDALEMFEKVGLTWATAESFVDTFGQFEGEVQHRGARARSGFHTMGAEEWTWTFKLVYVLCSTWREQVRSQEVIEALPSPEQLDSFARDVGTTATTTAFRCWFGNVLLIAAEVCLKLNRPRDGLLFVAAALRREHGDDKCDIRPTTLARGLSVRGQLLAAQGDFAHAEEAFAASMECANDHGLWLLELFALRDLSQGVLLPKGRLGEVEERVDAMRQRGLSLFAGTKEELACIGLDKICSTIVEWSQ